MISLDFCKIKGAVCHAAGIDFLMQDGAPVLLVNAQPFQSALMLIALSEIKVTAAKLKLIRIFSGDADFVFAVVLASVNSVFADGTAKPRGLLIIGIDVHIIIEEVPSTEDVFDGERREFPKVTFIRLHGIERIEIGGVGKIDHAVRLTEKTVVVDVSGSISDDGIVVHRDLASQIGMDGKSNKSSKNKHKRNDQKLPMIFHRLAPPTVR